LPSLSPSVSPSSVMSRYVSTSAPATTCSLKASVLTRILVSISPSLLQSVSACAFFRGLSQRADQCSCFHIVYLLQHVSRSATVSMSYALAGIALAFLLGSLSQNLPLFVFSSVAVSVRFSSSDFTFPCVLQIVSTSVSNRVSGSATTSVSASKLPLCRQVC